MLKMRFVIALMAITLAEVAFAHQPLKNSSAELGLRRVVLDKEVPFRDQIKQEGSIYVIRDIFTLNNPKGDNCVSIPKNCVLRFDGGGLKGGKLIGNNTEIEAGLVTIFHDDITLDGTWKVREAYPEWFSNNVKKR